MFEGKRRGVQPQNGIPGFFCVVQKNSAKEMGKFPQTGPKVAIGKFVWKMQKKSGIMKSGFESKKS